MSIGGRGGVGWVGGRERCHELYVLNDANDDGSLAHSDGIAVHDSASLERSKICDFDPY